MNEHHSPLLFNNKYLLKRKISSGSFGTVYQALDTESKKAVAIKLEELKLGDDELRSVLREA